MKILKYRKKPVVIEAIQFKDDPKTLSKLSSFLESTNRPVRVSYEDPKNPTMLIETLEGTMRADVGDYIIKGIQGECYPCKPDIFKATYEPVKEDA